MDQDLLFATLANPVRRRIVSLLLTGDLSAGVIAQSFDLSRSAVSEHLGLLRLADLVRETKSGRERIYTLNPEPVVELRAWLEPYEQVWKTRLAKMARDLEDEGT